MGAKLAKCEAKRKEVDRAQRAYLMATSELMAVAMRESCAQSARTNEARTEMQRKLYTQPAGVLQELMATRRGRLQQLDALEDNEDVQKVSSNVEIDNAVMADLAG